MSDDDLPALFPINKELASQELLELLKNIPSELHQNSRFYKLVSDSGVYNTWKITDILKSANQYSPLRLSVGMPLDSFLSQFIVDDPLAGIKFLNSLYSTLPNLEIIVNFYGSEFKDNFTSYLKTKSSVAKELYNLAIAQGQLTTEEHGYIFLDSEFLMSFDSHDIGIQIRDLGALDMLEELLSDYLACWIKGNILTELIPDFFTFQFIQDVGIDTKKILNSFTEELDEGSEGSKIKFYRLQQSDFQFTALLALKSLQKIFITHLDQERVNFFWQNQDGFVKLEISLDKIPLLAFELKMLYESLYTVILVLSFHPIPHKYDKKSFEQLISDISARCQFLQTNGLIAKYYLPFDGDVKNSIGSDDVQWEEALIKIQKEIDFYNDHWESTPIPRNEIDNQIVDGRRTFKLSTYIKYLANESNKIGLSTYPEATLEMFRVLNFIDDYAVTAAAKYLDTTKEAIVTEHKKLLTNIHYDYSADLISFTEIETEEKIKEPAPPTKKVHTMPDSITYESLELAFDKNKKKAIFADIESNIQVEISTEEIRFKILLLLIEELTTKEGEITFSSFKKRMQTNGISNPTKNLRHLKKIFTDLGYELEYNGNIPKSAIEIKKTN